MKRTKKILIGLLFFVLTVVGSTGVAYAWFSAQGKVRGINISVANSGLLVNGESEWTSGVNFNNIFPGWSSDPIAVAISNISGGDYPLEVKARVLFTGVDFDALAETMEMAIHEEGSLTAPDYQTLTWWSETGKVLGNFTSGEVKNYNLLFKVPSSAGDEIQNILLSVSVLLTGTQAI